MAEWIVTNCESVGNTHNVCQDHTEYMVSNNVHVGALADGVTSNRYSAEGAKAVTLIACQEMCENFEKYYSGVLSSRDLVHTIQKKVKLKYEKEYDINQMKSTLLLCAIYKNHYIIGHIGDGAVLCFGKESYVISPPQENEVGGTATYTILDYNADENFSFKIGEIDDFDGFLITSDGLLGNVYYSGTDIPQLAYELFGSVYKKSSPAQKGDRDAQFKAYLAEHIQSGNDLADDCSLFMIARKKQTGYVNYNVINGFEADVKWPCKCGNKNRMDEIRCSKCRTMYTALYPSAVIRINSKEGFFSKFNKWMLSDLETKFNPGVTAEILDYDGFTTICKVLKTSALDNIANRKEVMVNSSNSEQHIVRESNDVEREIPDHNYDVCQKEAEESVNTLERVAKLGINVIKKGLKVFSEVDSTCSMRQKTKKGTVSDKTIIQKGFSVVLSHDQMVEAAYQLKQIPMEFGNPEKTIDLGEEQKNVVKAMFCHNSFFDLFQYNDGIKIIHYYKVSNRIYAVYDDKSPNFYCTAQSDAREILYDSWLTPGSCFFDKIKKCNRLNAELFKYRKAILLWNWNSTYVNSKANASEMLRVFVGGLKKKGYLLDEIIDDIWFVAGNESLTEMVAYILTNQYLIRLRSIDSKHVEVEQVTPNDSSALQLREKYLIKEL